MGREEELAIEGGSPIIDTQIPSGVSGPSIVGEEEIAAVRADKSMIGLRSARKKR